MAFSTTPWDGSTLVLEAGGALPGGSMVSSGGVGVGVGPASLDALLFDVDDADLGGLSCPPRIVTGAAIATDESATRSVYSPQDSVGGCSLAGKRRAVASDARGKWPWPLRSERSGRVPQKEQRARLMDDLREMEAFVAELSTSRSHTGLSAAGDHETIAAVRVKSEREAKREAECRNQRLRQLNSEHTKRLKRIERVVTQSLSAWDQLQVSERLEYDSEKDAALYRDLNSSQDAQLMQMDHVFQAAGITPEMKKGESAQVVTDDKNGAFIRFVHTRLVPFPMMTILRAMQRYHGQYAVFPEQANAPRTEDVDPFTTLAIKARFILCHTDIANAKPVPLDSRGVGKVVRDSSDSVRGVWAGQGEWPQEYTLAGTASLPIRERGWVKLREFRSRGGQVYTFSQSCLHMTPGVAGGEGGMPTMSVECVALLAESIIPSYRRILEGRQQLMENAFMDELMREQKAGGSSDGQAHKSR